MKKLFTFLLGVSVCSIAANSQLLKKLGKKVENKSEQRADSKVDQTIDKGLDKTEDGIKNAGKDNGNTTTPGTNTNNSPNNNKKDTVAQENPMDTPPLKVYANYDFVPGDIILFEDNFTDDADGEFPSHWDLEAGQGILNKFSGSECFYLTDGNYARVMPLTKTKAYLTDPFTIEYDVYNPNNAAYGLMTFFRTADGSELGSMRVTPEDVSCSYADGKSLSGSLPKDIQYENFKNKWHHVAIAYKNKQIKIYVDQYRVLVIPNSGIVPEAVDFGGIGDPTNPIIFKNVRIAKGGDMNMLGKKFTETKIVTHGINFDIDKATIKPESMGTLNMIVQVMKDNPDIKFEIDGHTDNSGAAAHNLSLSQQRAGAVKDQLVTMGIDAARLTTKGWGDSKPISENSTIEGKANNRRVEFVKL